MIDVPDAGPLIYLGGADQLGLLRVLFAEVIVPRLVFDRVTVAGAGKPGSAAVLAADWLIVVDAAPDPALLTRLDAGEASAIPLAERLRATLLIDDADGRADARGRGLTVVGTLGVLLAATHRGHLASVRPVIEQMAASGMHVSASLLAEVLRIARAIEDALCTSIHEVGFVY